MFNLRFLNWFPTSFFALIITIGVFSFLVSAGVNYNEDVSFRDRVWGFNHTSIWNIQPRSGLYINDTICLWNATTGWQCMSGGWGNFTGGSSGGGGNKSYFFNNTAATHDGSLGGYSGANAVCAAEFAGTHLCSKQELLDTISDKALPADWSGEAWINSGAANGYHTGNPTNDCLGWTTNSASDYLGGWWDFGTGYTDAKSWLINCGMLKSLACCKAW